MKFTIRLNIICCYLSRISDPCLLKVLIVEVEYVGDVPGCIGGGRGGEGGGGELTAVGVLHARIWAHRRLSAQQE